MHDGTEIIRSIIIPIGNVLVKIVLSSSLDILPMYDDMLVAILPALFMSQPQGVADFVNRISGATAARKTDLLFTALHADL